MTYDVVDETRDVVDEMRDVVDETCNVVDEMRDVAHKRASMAEDHSTNLTNLGRISTQLICYFLLSRSVG